MTSRGQLLVVGLHALLGLSVLISATVLSALHDPISATLSALFGIILGLAGAGSAAVATLGAATNGKATVPPQLIADLQTNLHDAVEHLAGARATIDAATIAGGRRATDPPRTDAGEPPPL